MTASEALPSIVCPEKIIIEPFCKDRRIMKRMAYKICALMITVGLSCALVSCGGDEPNSNEGNNGGSESPGGPSAPGNSVPEGFYSATLTQNEGDDEVELEWGTLYLSNGILAMKNGGSLRQTVFAVGPMDNVTDITKALYSGYPISDDYREYGRPRVGYGYLAQGIHGSIYSRIYVTNVEYNPLRVSLIYEKRWTAIPENAYIDTHGTTLLFGRGAFADTDVVTLSIPQVIAPRGYEIVSKPDFVTEATKDQFNFYVTIDITKNPLPAGKRTGDIILANEWMQSRVPVVVGGDF